MSAHAPISDQDEPESCTEEWEPGIVAAESSLMIPGWLVRASRDGGISYGALLVYACLLLYASDHHVCLVDEPYVSCCYAVPSRVAAAVGLSTNHVRRILQELRTSLLLIKAVGELTIFLAHPWMGEDGRVGEGAALDVTGRWANDAFYLPRRITSQPASRLSPGEKVFFAVLLKYEKRWWHKVAAKQTTLGHELGIGERQVQKLVSRLEAKGLVEVVEDRRRSRRTNVMRTHIREPWVGKSRDVARADLHRLRARHTSKFG